MIESDPSSSSSYLEPSKGLTDGRLVALVALVLFVLGAWPLLLVDLPPFQDIPNHVAIAHMIAHPDLYPEFAFNGLYKSNSALTLWFYLLGGHGLFGAARGFVALVLAVTALALPVFVLRFAGRRALWPAMGFAWPLVHSFAVVMGFLNYALGFGLSLILLAVLDRQRERATSARGAAIVALSVVLWYAHPFPLAVVGALCGLHCATRASWPERRAAALALLLPLAPAGLLALVAAQHHLIKAEHANTQTAGTFVYLNPWEILAHLWTDVSGALTRFGSMTLVPALLLPILVWNQRPPDRPLLSNRALAMLAVAYVGLPVMLSNWWYLQCRLVPFLWAGLLLRLPRQLPRPLVIGLAACALSFSAVTGIDYLRLDRDRAEFTAGMSAVPTRATLLPLLFEKSKTGDFVATLTHAWGYYTVGKDTSAALVFAAERSYPITYRTFPPRALIPPALDRFAEQYATPAQVCKIVQHFPIDAACTALWREIWDAFWQQAEPRFGHLLVWAMPAEARPLIPARYHRVFASGDLEIYAREPREYKTILDNAPR